MPRSDDESTALTQLGRAISRRRAEARLTQEKLSDLSGLHRTYIGSVERGERNPTYTSLLSIARGLGTDLPTLLSGLGK